MTPYRDHRTHERKPCRAHVEFECLSGRDHKLTEAFAYNMSDDGLYLETVHEVRPGQSILIHGEEMPEEQYCKPLVDNTGIVRWTRAMERETHLLYGLGVRFYYPDQEAGLKDLMYFCDMCGRRLRLKDVRQQKGPVWMCPRCNEFTDHLPDTLSEELDRYLIGNAL